MGFESSSLGSKKFGKAICLHFYKTTGGKNTMMLSYLKDHILDEVDDALDYMSKAIEHKGTPDGCTFRKMSEMELEHANALTHMFRHMDRPAEMSDEEYGSTQKQVLDKYVDAMAKYEAMKKLYQMQN